MISTLVIGGGIGGLSLARELAIRSMPVTVLERAPQLNPVGAGIIMNPNAMRLLEKNGLADAVRADSWPYLLRETRDQKGRLLAVRDYLPLYDSGKLARGALVHRAHLLDVLWNGVPKESVHFGVKVEGISVYPDRVKINTFQKSFEADILVGADGIHSQVRRHLFGEMKPRYMGYRSHRLVVDNVAGTQQFTEYLGDGQRIGLVPISDARLYVWTTFNSPEHRPPRFATADEWRAVFGQFTDAQVKRALGEVRSADEIITTDIEELALERWSEGRAALLGDAAHAMTPNIGQGAGMAMEDAAVLAEELARASRPEEALQNYQRRRRPRIETVMRISREVGEEGQCTGRLACWLRNRRIRRAGRDTHRMLADLERLLAYSG